MGTVSNGSLAALTVAFCAVSLLLTTLAHVAAEAVA